MREPALKTRNKRRSDPKALARFIEQLSWLMSSNEDLDFRALRNMVREFSSRPRSDFYSRGPRVIDGFAPKNPNISFLVGSLPGLFNNPDFFSSNEEIAEFAKIALQVKIPRWQKKSKFELIGHVVCNTAKLGDKRLEILVRALSKIVGDEKHAKEVFAAKRQQKSSWNEVIQRLYETD
jgi:hypothetical protein